MSFTFPLLGICSVERYVARSGSVFTVCTKKPCTQVSSLSRGQSVEKSGGSSMSSPRTHSGARAAAIIPMMPPDELPVTRAGRFTTSHNSSIRSKAQRVKEYRPGLCWLFPWPRTSSA